MNNMLYHKAIEFATLAHLGQNRKGSNVPYIVHPIEVSLILSNMIDNDKRNSDFKSCCVISGLLHDSLEDTKTTYETLKNEFGDIIANVVLDNSEDKTKTWEERKRHTINTINNKCLESQMVCFADKLSNIRSLKYDYKNIGEELWDSFKRGKSDQKWYYGELMKSFNIFSKNYWYQEYIDIYNEVFKY